ncbi:cation transporter [Pontibacter akesuensis]|uniref:Cation efflux family protein n=1 Tax=Pontibacter akesuensis TaxID=388950 RepID=A0A1I7JAH0_9BACT|nr:cation transporter [Pontibacter akesuensis]GHA71447.1 membrane protein [Pontibacter akesuensis]SFU82113.1 Cation efflux family protein [Pontibacter akesuensis]
MANFEENISRATIQENKATANNTGKLLKTAFILSMITIVYNLAEGVVSVYFGLEDDTLSLLGFGLDSFVEVISGIGIAHMVWRMQHEDLTERSKFEKRALQVTGTSFYLLTAGLVVGAILNLMEGSAPETTVTGIIVSAVSICTMFFLMRYKLSVGHKLNSAPIIADANCTKACFYLSILLLVASGLYELFHIGYIDILGSLGIAYFAFKEGKESWEKAGAASLSDSCGDGYC